MQQISKQELIERLINHPLEFNETDFSLITKSTDLSFLDLRSALIRIFDINETIMLEESDATKGLQGKLNKFSNQKRQKKFYKKFRNGEFKRKNNKLILAEGDSWFEFPLFIKDIINHLNKNKSYNIYSLAYSGDWIANIIYDGRYIEKLSAFGPDVFLISGGGNDLVGVDRIGVMVDINKSRSIKYKNEQEIINAYENAYSHATTPLAIKDYEISAIRNAQPYINKEFHAFILLLKLQYYMIFSGIDRKFPHMQIITHGYDYAIPHSKYHFSIKRPFQYFVNRLLKNGSWLKIPLLIKGINNEELQRDIILFMIFELNLMFAHLSKFFNNVYHIDCRGVAENIKDWYDELHLLSNRYRTVANAYNHAIDNFNNCDRILFASRFRR